MLDVKEKCVYVYEKVVFVVKMKMPSVLSSGASGPPQPDSLACNCLRIAETVFLFCFSPRRNIAVHRDLQDLAALTNWAASSKFYHRISGQKKKKIHPTKTDDTS